MSTTDTGGGAHIGGNVQAGRDFVGRDQINQGLQGQDLARFTELFGAVYRQVDAHATKDAEADPDLLKDTAKKIEKEVGKGYAADTNQCHWQTTHRSSLQLK